MNKHRTRNQRSIKINFSIIVIPLFILVGIVFLMFQSKQNSAPSIVSFVTEAPTMTSTPLPATIREIQASCSKGECVYACMAHVNKVLQQAKYEFPEYNAEDVDLVYYGVSKSDELEKPRDFGVSGDLLSLRENVDAHNMVWNYFKTLFPREKRPNLVTFGIYVSSISDGKFDTTLTDNWIMKINILSLQDAYYLSSALVHEYGHYLTLNATQKDIKRNKWGICEQQPLYYCQAPDSYINLFYLEFWEDIYPEWEKINWQSVYYEKEIDLFYQKYEDRFLNDYAATDPIEDITESWTAFVLETPPSGNSIAEQKINFFYDFPELIQLRYQIIQGICTFETT